MGVLMVLSNVELFINQQIGLSIRILPSDQIKREGSVAYEHWPFFVSWPFKTQPVIWLNPGQPRPRSTPLLRGPPRKFLVIFFITVPGRAGPPYPGPR